MAGKDFDGDLAALAAAFEAGLDLPAVLGAACRAVSTALEAGPAPDWRDRARRQRLVNALPGEPGIPVEAAL